MAVSGVRGVTSKSIFNNFKNSVSNTCHKVIDFIKRNFFNIFSAAAIIGSFFYFPYKVTIGLVITCKILNIIKIISSFSQKILRKIGSLGLTKREVLPFHDSRRWLEIFNSSGFFQRKIMLKKIGLQTLQTIRNLGVKDIFSFSKRELDKMKKNTLILGKDVKNQEDEENYFQQALKKNTLPTKSALSKVEVIQGDSFNVAITLGRENSYKNIAVLNMANKDFPGGGFLHGSSAQEEALCRRSNLFDSININNSEKNNCNDYLRKKMKGKYQIPEFGGIYSPKVKVFRAEKKDGFAYLEKPKEVNIISSAAYDLKHQNPSNYREKTKMKIQMILNSALETNQELLVLGAFGCGAFNNDPKEIANIVKDVLKKRPIYQQKMKIVFAIVKDRNDKRGNIENFSTLDNFIN